MIYESLAILAGFILLIWSAERFVTGAAAIAANLNVSPLIIGLTIVGFGTSAPEMVVAMFAALGGNPGLAIGNAIGSNIANIALILGVTALVIPLNVHSRILKKELPLLLGAMVLMVVLLLDGHLSRLDGVLLFSSLIVLLWWITRQAMSEKQDAMEQEFEQELPDGIPLGKAVWLLIIGLIVLLGSSKLLVWGAVGIAQALGVSDLIIGLTIIAIGTSLPELAASIAAALKKEHDLVVGNIVGSNIFNTLAVMGIPGMIWPAALPDGLLERDVLVMFVLTFALFIMAFGFKKAGRINRVEAGLLCCGFIAYESWLYHIAVSGSGTL